MSWRASSGMHAWLIQRMTAIYMVLYIAYLILSLTQISSFKYQTWHNWISSSHNKVTLTIFFFAVLFHAWIGTRDIVIDYVKPLVLRIILLFTVIALCLGYGVWVLNILYQVT